MLPFGRLTNAPCAVLGIDKNVPRCFASSEVRARLGKKEAQSHSWNTTDELATKTVPEISSLHATGCLQVLPWNRCQNHTLQSQQNKTLMHISNTRTQYQIEHTLSSSIQDVASLFNVQQKQPLPRFTLQSAQTLSGKGPTCKELLFTGCLRGSLCVLTAVATPSPAGIQNHRKLSNSNTPLQMYLSFEVHWRGKASSVVCKLSTP